MRRYFSISFEFLDKYKITHENVYTSCSIIFESDPPMIEDSYGLGDAWPRSRDSLFPLIISGKCDQWEISKKEFAGSWNNTPTPKALPKGQLELFKD